VPVIDFVRFMGLADDASGTGDAPPPGSADERRIVVLNLPDRLLGLLVDEVRSIVAYRDDELLAMPAYSRRHVALFAGCLGSEGHDSMILLNPDALAAHERLAAITRGHRELYRERSTEADAARERSGGRRETYVTFRLGQLLGVRIGQLREVIDYSDAIVVTPGAPGFIRGVLQVRRELLTVIDVRAMYGMAPYEDLTHAKILVVDYGGDKYGLVVDAVDNIVTLDSARRIAVPALLTRQSGTDWGNGMTEAIELPGRGTLMLIDPAALCERAAAHEAGLAPAAALA